ncbi:MAG: V-type ATP synthase subunit F [Sulfolobales archaeon]|nr:hypothetical protein [Sulfolobales archaeon]MCX8208699.1 hypothetical protein [Sulfolobales archaeon]MDW8010941.1 V-type ATP synthase subunit F [Sulfolobales archaeon]
MVELPEFKKLKLVAVVRKELLPLLKTLGVGSVVVADDTQSAALAIEELVKSDDIAVVLVQKSLMRSVKIPAETHSKLYPILVEIPDEPADVAVEPREYYRELVRKFIGYEIYVG